MKKIILLIILFLLMPLIAKADLFLGIKKSTESFSLPLKEPLDADGLPQKPDSFHIYAYADNASAATYITRSISYPFSDISIDTLKSNGDTTYWLKDDIADIDGAGGHFVLGIDVVAWTGGLPTHTHATVQIIVDSLSLTLDPSNFATTATVAKASADSLVNKAIADTANGKAYSRVIEAAVTGINQALYSGFYTGTKTISSYNANVDTLFIYGADGVTLINRWLFFHVGQTAGYRPDSVKMIGP